MLRRLLKDLQKSVESRFGKHVHLVDDVHALFHLCGREDRLIAQQTDILHAVVGRGVELCHVEDGPVLDPAAGRAGIAWVPVDGMLAVDRLGQYPRAGRFARAARADEQVSVAEPPCADLVLQRFGDSLLTHNIIKGPGPVFAV